MAKFDLKSYARAGAAARVSELLRELQSIYKMFPDLAGGRKARGGTDTIGIAPGRRKRKPMTAAQKKVVSERMRKYWASRRKAEK